MILATVSISLVFGILVAIAFAAAYLLCSDKYPKLVTLFLWTYVVVLLATLIIHGKGLLG